jgi:hypothetical protein
MALFLCLESAKGKKQQRITKGKNDMNNCVWNKPKEMYSVYGGRQH